MFECGIGVKPGSQKRYLLIRMLFLDELEKRLEEAAPYVNIECPQIAGLQKQLRI